MNASPLRAWRASLLDFADDPRLHEDESRAARYVADGLLVVRNGKIAAAGPYSELAATLPAGTIVEDLGGKLLMPGMIDAHVHYPQTDIIASPASGLLPWLNTYTFPEEGRFGDPEYAAEVAGFFLDTLLAGGTTTAAVYCTVHPQSADAFFAQSEKRNTRMIAGKVMMDRHAPDFLLDTAESGAAQSETLLQRWHGKGRQLYALTPRFAPTSTDAQLRLTGELAAAYPDVFIQSHVAENRDEIKWALELFPGSRSYLDVYERFGLLRERAVYGHGIWFDDEDRRRMTQTGAVAALCPTSNLFLGSGLFDFPGADKARMPLAMATDVGGGTSFSLLQTMNELHKVARMGGTRLSAVRMFYLATLGGARALKLDGMIGSFAPGMEADFIALDPQATPLLARRIARTGALEELLFAYTMLGGAQAVGGTWIAGERFVPRGAS
ncbi:MAG: guanine deaminase [Candidatus Protistobacter heckmanni]|nr:guanine deaminase [Candidatus Protistobacter heckmanni]